MTVVMVMYVFDAANQNHKRGYQSSGKPSNPEIFSPCLFVHAISPSILLLFNSPKTMRFVRAATCNLTNPRANPNLPHCPVLAPSRFEKR
jgi:hypothetical protein